MAPPSKEGERAARAGVPLHYPERVFPAFSIGSSAFVATLLVLWRRTAQSHYHRLARFWTKIFAVSFAMGVVSGIPLSYEFGTNWARFSLAAGNVIGPLVG